MSRTPGQPINVFVSYAHEDDAERRRLRKTLKWMERKEYVRIWTDHEIVAGKRWRKEIEDAFHRANLVILLVSLDFQASDFIYGEELPLAMKAEKDGTKTVVPIKIKDVHDSWEEYTELQGLPTGFTPIAEWPTPDAFWKDVSEGMERVLRDRFPDLFDTDAVQSGRATYRPGLARDQYTPQIFRLPGQNKQFTGRVGDLEQLHDQLHAQGTHTTAITHAEVAAVTGLGGLGKTELAIEYAWRYAGAYTHIWYIVADEPVALRSAFADLAKDLRLPEQDPRIEEQVRIDAVKAWLEEPQGSWLIVYDNVNEPEQIKPYLVHQGNGRQLITSRHHHWGEDVSPLQLGLFTDDEARQYIHTRLDSEISFSDDDADQLSAEMGYLPLALAQATSYIAGCGKSIADYLVQFRSEKGELLKGGKGAHQYPDTVWTTWDMSLNAAADRLEKEELPCELGRDLLRLISFFASEAIPLETIRKYHKKLPKPLRSVIASEAKLDRLINALKQFSLLGRNGNNLSVHRLVQAVTLDQLTLEEVGRWGIAALEVILEVMRVLDLNDHRTWPMAQRHLAHAMRSVEETERLGLKHESQADLLRYAGWYKQSQLDFEGAEGLFEKAHETAVSVAGADSAVAACALNGWAGQLYLAGDLEGAKQRYERALVIDEAVYGSDHPNVAINLNNLAMVLQDQGDLEGAKECSERALEIGEKTLGPDHPKVAIRLSNLAQVLQAKGDLGGAKQRFERVLKIIENEYEPNHPHVAIALNNLALVLKEQGDLEGAKQRYERALEIDEAVYATNHPKLAIRLNNLAMVHEKQGDLEGAKQRYERALAIFTAIYGPDHPHTKIVQGHLDHLLKRM